MPVLPTMSYLRYPRLAAAELVSGSQARRPDKRKPAA